MKRRLKCTRFHTNIVMKEILHLGKERNPRRSRSTIRLLCRDRWKVHLLRERYRSSWVLMLEWDAEGQQLTRNVAQDVAEEAKKKSCMLWFLFLRSRRIKWSSCNRFPRQFLEVIYSIPESTNTPRMFGVNVSPSCKNNWFFLPCY